MSGAAQNGHDGAAPRTRVAVRWRDFDPLGHVNSVVFLTYLEEGRTKWLQEILEEPITGDQWVVAHVELDYLSEIPAGRDFVETEHRVVRIGKSSVTFQETLYTEGDTMAATGHVVIVMWRPGARESRPFTVKERAALQARMSPVSSDASSAMESDGHVGGTTRS